MLCACRVADPIVAHDSTSFNYPDVRWGRHLRLGEMWGTMSFL